MSIKPTSDQIAAVKRTLPSTAGDDFHWFEDKIAAILTVTDCSLAQTVRQFWLERVVESYEFIDVNETGSSRSLSQVHTNAKAMLEYWDKQVEAEGVVSLRRPISFGVIDAS